MNPDAARLSERIALRLSELKLTERAASLKATGQPDTLRFVRKRGVMPSLSKLIMIAQALETSVAYLVGQADDPKPDPAMQRLMSRVDQNLAIAAATRDTEAQAVAYETAAQTLDERADRMLRQLGEHNDRDNEELRRSLSRIRNVPLVSATLGESAEVKTRSGASITVETMAINRHEVVGMMDRPAALDERRGLYGIYICVMGLDPVYEPGTGVIIDPTRPARAGDYVLACISQDDDLDRVISGRLIRRAPDVIDLDQYTPPGAFRIPVHEVIYLHRLVPVNEMLGV